MIARIHPTCDSLRPDHQAHAIQCRLARESLACVDVTLTFEPDEVVVIHTPAEVLRKWNHDYVEIRQWWDEYHTATWNPEFRVLSLPGSAGFGSHMIDADARTPCIGGHAAVDTTDQQS